MVQVTRLNLPVFFPVSFPPSYRGRWNRGKVRSFLFRDKTGIAGKGNL